MTTTETVEKPYFEMDFTNPEEVATFPEDFAKFLVRSGRETASDEFLIWLSQYVDKHPPEELSLWDIVRGAARWAEIYDASGVPFEENPLFNPHSERLSDEPVDSAEQVLEELDRDTPTRMEPDYPEVLVFIEEGDDIAILVHKTVLALRKRGYKYASERLAKDIRGLVRAKATYGDVYDCVAGYVRIATHTRLKREEELIREHQRAS